jgi:hypothetical protein
MSTGTIWCSDDPCPACGAFLTDLPADAHRLAQECRCCGWTVTWMLTGGDR